MPDDLIARAQEIAECLQSPEVDCIAYLAQGFGPLHAAVAESWRRAAPGNEAEILDWYRNTPVYIWELSAYHLDPGFNYMGMCQGIADRLLGYGVKRVLCLADGIGDLTLSLRSAGIEAVYNDLDRSATAAYAMFHYWQRMGRGLPCQLSADWKPDIRGPWGAIVSLDFLEHCPNVEEWVRAIHAGLVLGGWFVAQNAFACGSGPQGSIPMHLQCNDRYETDWAPLLSAVGFRQEGSQWYQKM